MDTTTSVTNPSYAALVQLVLSQQDLIHRINKVLDVHLDCIKEQARIVEHISQLLLQDRIEIDNLKRALQEFVV